MVFGYSFLLHFRRKSVLEYFPERLFLFLKQSIHLEPTFASRGKTIKQEKDARNGNNDKSNVYSHNQFPFFLLFVNTNPTINAEIEMTNEQM